MEIINTKFYIWFNGVTEAQINNRSQVKKQKSTQNDIGENI